VYYRIEKGEIVSYKISVLCLLLAGFAIGREPQQPALASGQPALTNDSIIKMLKAGLGEDLIVSTVKTQPGRYSIGLDDLIALKGAGVTDKIITAMVERMAPGGSDRVVSPPPNEGNAPVTDVGVYWKKAGAWAELPPEVVDFKTGGVFHVSGGATLDLLPFGSKNIAPRTYEIALPNLNLGEYGFLPPASSDSPSSAKTA
jgi:hypothetical protein